ncbi:hypothetical protein S1OALGB6SA_687 [Olavius algarvensis spirochete endosymbiont]|uniref:HEAT repeat domain-containing protein n=1 Tax=Olavius algarvensis spirochete endosymbiont TaxID=260710 RepID=UPI000F277C13|nr:HEAT repeat domain-containing protein [Olavius algarvensis spirochete endosymbiont]VDA99616.1 hypothetical protein S1OALGB6SA_687 [Olavius algarvensis spirochete endosymbiont]
MRTRTTSMVLGILLCQLLAAQEQTIEELYLQGDIKTMMMKAEAESSDRNFKMSALEKIEKMIADGSASDNTQIVDILSNLASESVSSIAREQGYILNDYPEVRREAVRLLGLIGSNRTTYELGRVLLNDPEPMVTSEAILAITSIDDNEDRVLRDQLIYRAMRRQTVLTRDNRLASIFISSVEAIVQRDLDKINPLLLAEVVRIAEAGSGYNHAVRKQASGLLRDFQNL